MEEMLKKIIEVDEEARKIKEEAQHQKIISEQETEELKQQIYDDYMERAKDRVEKNTQITRQKRQERWEAFSKELQRKKAVLESTYTEKKDQWVDEIVAEVIG